MLEFVLTPATDGAASGNGLAILGMIVSAVAAAAAIWAAIHARTQASMAQTQAATAIRAADAANEQAASAREQVTVAEEQLELAKRVRLEEQEPHIVVDIIPAPHAIAVFMLVIENIGAAVARNVRISFDQPLHRAVEERYPGQHALSASRMFTDGIPQMPPGRRIELLFDSADIRREAQLPMQYTASVQADWIGGQVEAEYFIDLSVYYDLNFLPGKTMDDGVKALTDVADELKAIKTKLPEQR